MQVAGQTQVSYAWDNANRLTSITQGSTAIALNYEPAHLPDAAQWGDRELWLRHGFTGDLGYLRHRRKLREPSLQSRQSDIYV